MKFHAFIAAMLVALTFGLAADRAEAQAYSGGWYFLEGGGSQAEQLWLGDGNNYGLHMRGTSRYCGQPGASYARIRQILVAANDFGNGFVTWWIADDCTDGYVRVCVQNPYNQSACSTYADWGWGPRP